MYFKESDQMPFVTSDPHYFHHNITQYCSRPFKSEQAMRNKLLENYNDLVPKDGTCFFIGDMAMIGTSQWEKMKALLNKMNGTKHLILGNHDEIKPFRYIDCGFTSVHTSLVITMQIGVYEVKFCLNHDPCVWDLVPDDVILLCGHVHNLFKILPDKNVVNVGVDVWNFKPITFFEAWDTLNKWKQKEYADLQSLKFRDIPLREEVIEDRHKEEKWQKELKKKNQKQ